jgi:hypothetical protein
MDPLRKEAWFSTTELEMEGARRAMGHTRTFAERIRLAILTPRPELASTRYCLAIPGDEYLVYQPNPGAAFTVELKAGSYHYEWFDPSKGANASTGNLESSSQTREFKPPFNGDAVLHLKAVQ